MKLTRKQLRKIILEEVQTVQLNLNEDASTDLTEWFRVNITEMLKENAKPISENFPYGTQTAVETLITARASSVVECMLEDFNPVDCIEKLIKGEDGSWF